MADTLTLLQVRTQARQRANMENSSFVTDSELNDYINSSYKEFYDLLVDAVEDYNITEFSFSITSGNTQALPATHYKFRGLDDLSDVNEPKTVRKYNWNERNDYNSSLLLGGNDKFSDVVYRIIGDNIVILPPGRAARAYKLYYTPYPSTLVADGSTLVGINGWLEYVIVDVAIKCLIKEESDIRPLTSIKNALAGRIESMKANRDQGQPEKISRIRSRRRLAGYYDTVDDVL